MIGKKKENLNLSLLHEVTMCRLVKARKLISQGADVNARYNNFFRPTLLQLTAAKGDLKFVKMLLDNGADANAVDAEGDTALYYAAAYGRMDVMQLLIQRGADIEYRNYEDMTLIEKLEKMKKPDVVGQLQEAIRKREETHRQLHARNINRLDRILKRRG